MRGNNFDSKGFMAPYGENGILFTSENYALRKKAGLNLSEIEGHSYKAMQHVFNENRTDITFGDEKDTWSHDNHTGLVCLSKNMDDTLHKKFFYKQWWRRAHPRDWIFFWWIKGGLVGAIANCFMWIHTLIVLQTCLDTRKASNGKLDTDGKILAWLRVNSFHMPITKKIVNWAIDKHGGWKDVFIVYFGLNHPNSQFSEEVYKA
jgi:hypothetical protein